MNAKQQRKLRREQQAKISKLILDRIGLTFEKSAITDSMIKYANRDMEGFLASVKRAFFE